MESRGVEVFPFQFDQRYRLARLLFGITLPTAEVRVTASALAVRLGPWYMRIPRDHGTDPR